MYFNVINYIVFQSIYVSSFFAINIFLLIFMSMLTKYKQLLLSIAAVIMATFNIYAGYLFLSRDVVPYDGTVGFNSLTEFREYEEIYFFSEEYMKPMKLPRIQMALPNTWIKTVADITEVSSDNVLFACSQDIIFAIMEHRLNVSISAVESGIVQVHEYTVGGNTVLLPALLFSSQNGVIHENTITSNGDYGFLLFGPYILLESGSYKFSAQLELLNQNEAPYYVGHAELSFFNGASTFNHQPLYIGDFEDGALTVFFEIDIAEPMPSFEIRVLASEGAQLRVSNISVLLADPD
jgi:hypothetical protein